MGKGRPGAKRAEPVTAPSPETVANAEKEQYDDAGNRLTTDPWSIARWTLAALVVFAIGGTAWQWSRQPETGEPTREAISQEQDPPSPAPQAQGPAATPGPAPDQPAPVATPERLVKRLGGHNDWVNAVTAISGTSHAASADAAGNIILWDIRSGAWRPMPVAAP